MICRDVHKSTRGLWKGKLCYSPNVNLKKDKHWKSVFHVLEKINSNDSNYH